MNQDYLLSICIPTYNRSNQLSHLLDSIIHQIDPRVEVVVSDNGSTDSTLEMLTKYSKNYRYIRYHRFNENKGVVENYPTVGGMASGKYLWFVGSDDEIAPKGIETLLIFLLSHDPIDGLFVNFKICDNALNDVKASFWSRLNQKTEVLTNHREAFVKYWHYAGFFSGSVFRRDVWNLAVATLPIKKYPHFLHMLVAGYILRNSKKWGFVSDECIRYRAGDTDCLHAFGGAYLLIVKEIDEVGKALRYLSQGDWILTYRAEKIGVELNLAALLFANMKSGMSVLNRMRLFKKLVRYFWWHPYFWGIIVPVLMMPGRMLHFARDSYIKWFR